ncbi:MAG: tRNA (cytidine(34)-2'-O)-methyltransferase [Parachlamydiaceae bacterium]|nr:tRNA (cytidine(34)-2'-O)-methyltransferase [Parachlamydiaceae bacterium]
MQIILYQPQIPQNTGNVVRSCSVTGASLGLVSPFGFSLSDRWLKRAGLDYWEGVDLTLIDDLKAHLAQAPGKVYLFSSKAKKCYADAQYMPQDWLIFGSETTGLPAWLIESYPETCVTLPMKEGSRCLNLATTVGIAIYEAWRQLNFAPLKQGSEKLP